MSKCQCSSNSLISCYSVSCLYHSVSVSALIPVNTIRPVQELLVTWVPICSYGGSTEISNVIRGIFGSERPTLP